MRWTVQQVAEALGVAAPAGVDAVAGVAGVAIDSRTVGAGELFLAIHGPRHDGHDYVDAALGRGAVAAVVARARMGNYTEATRQKLIGVDDTLAALHKLAWTARNHWRAANSRHKLAAVTGSAGKTTTKEILAALLGTRCRVLKNEGNLNNEYGAPLTLLRLKESHDAAVLELGMSRRGELERLALLTEPEVGVVTLVAPVHLEFFASLEEIALAKRELVENLAGAAPVAVLNADDARVAAFAEHCRGTVLTFGFSASADFRAVNVEERGTEGCSFDLVAPSAEKVASDEWPLDFARDKRVARERTADDDERRTDVRRDSAALTRRSPRVRLELPLAGRHNVLNALAALAAASVWGVGVEEARSVFPSLAPAKMRGEVLKFQAGFTVINDCYNSNPAALATMINVLAGTMGYQRRILAAGEMLELGADAPRLHHRAGQQAATAGVDWIFGVQGDAAELVRGAQEAGLPASRTQFFNSSEDAAAFLREFVEPGDILLVKGSRGVRMERIVEALAGKHELAEKAN